MARRSLVDRILALLPWYDPATVARRARLTAEVHRDAIVARIDAENAAPVMAVRRIERMARGPR